LNRPHGTKPGREDAVTVTHQALLQHQLETAERPAERTSDSVTDTLENCEGRNLVASRWFSLWQANISPEGTTGSSSEL